MEICPKSQYQFGGRKHSKDKRVRQNCIGPELKPRAMDEQNLGEKPFSSTYTHDAHYPICRAHARLGINRVFPIFLCGFVGKIQFFNPNLVENLYMFTRTFIHLFSFIMLQFKRKESSRSINRRVSLHPLSLEYVLFLL